MEHRVSPISFLFFGRYRSVVVRRKARDSATLEPFHCVSLEIQDPSIHTLTDALLHLSRPEHLEAGITKTVTIETAPPVLLIHLKRFIYDVRYGVEKLNKFIAYPLRLELSRKVLASDATLRHTPIYHLHAVIYHHGRTADGGHYTCNVCQCPSEGEQAEHSGGGGNEAATATSSRWIHCDDASVAEIPESKVTAEKGAWQTAYILVYIRA